MVLPTRNKIETLVTRYKLHPDTLDIYVEGKFDKDFLDFVIHESGHAHRIKVYEIGTVEVPAQLIDEVNKKQLWPHPLWHESCKHRLIAFAHELCSLAAPSNVSCLVDADCDRLLEKQRKSAHLFYTKFTCMETYALDSTHLQKFFLLQCGLKAEKLQEFINIAEQILPTLFVLRAVNEKLALAAKMPDYTKAKEGKSWSTFSENRLIDNFIQLNQRHTDKDKIYSTYNELKGKLGEDIRDKSHGHDFIELLYDFVMDAGCLTFSKKQAQVENHGNRILLSAIPSNAIFSQEPFLTIDTAARYPSHRLWV